MRRKRRVWADKRRRRPGLPLTAPQALPPRARFTKWPPGGAAGAALRRQNGGGRRAGGRTGEERLRGRSGTGMVEGL